MELVLDQSHHFSTKRSTDAYLLTSELPGPDDHNKIDDNLTHETANTNRTYDPENDRRYSEDALEPTGYR